MDDTAKAYHWKLLFGQNMYPYATGYFDGSALHFNISFPSPIISLNNESLIR